VPHTILIPHDYGYRKYFPGTDPLPVEATGAQLRAELLKRAPGLDVRWARDATETDAALPAATILFSYGVRRAQLDRAPHLTWIQAGSAGIDHFLKLSEVDAAELARRGIRLTSAAGVTRLVIGEQVLACMLMFVRGMVRALDQQRARRWEIFCAEELHGSTVGIIGLGGIGERVAELAKAFGTRVIATKRDPAVHGGHADLVLGADAVEQVMAEADFLVLSAPITAATRGLINRQTLALMKPTARLINVGRGELIVEADLVAALRDGTLAGAALDTFGSARTAGGRMEELEALAPDSPLWDMPNVIITPNHAAGTRRIYAHMAELFLRNLRIVEAGGTPPGTIA